MFKNKNNLSKLRKRLDNVDNQILNLLNERFAITRKVGIYKAEFDLPSLDKNREKEIYEKLAKKSELLNIDKHMVLSIWKIIMAQSKKEHKDIKKKL